MQTRALVPHNMLLQSAMARSLDVMRQEGVSGLVRRCGRRLFSVDTQILMECALDSRKTAEAGSPPDGYSCLWASIDDLERYGDLGLTHSDDARRAAQDRLARGERCVVGLSHGTPATYLWITATLRELPRLELTLGDGSIFVYKTFTLPSFRGRGFSQAAMSWTLIQYAAEGYRRAFIDIETSNVPSLRAAAKSGFREIGRFAIIHMPGLAFTVMGKALRARVSGE